MLFYRLLIIVSVTLFLLLTAGLFIYTGGLLLYRLLIFPRRKIRGVLLYWKTIPEGDSGDLSQELKLHALKKESVTISFNPENKTADFYIQGSRAAHDLLIKNSGGSTRPHYLQGWGALLGRRRPLMTVVQCTMPGVIESAGGIFTRKELFHAHKFATGGFTFQYQNPYGKWFRDKKTGGVNILEGRV